MKLLSIIHIFFIIFFFSTSCQKDSLGDDSSLVSFSEEIAPFFEVNCTECHYGGRQSPNLHDSVSYSQLIEGGYVLAGDADESPLMIKLENNHPEKGIVSNDQLGLIETWINQGAENN